MNYELDLLRGMLKYAGCWTPELEIEYQPLPELKSKVGKAATVQQLSKIIKTAKANESWGRNVMKGIVCYSCKAFQSEMESNGMPTRR